MLKLISALFVSLGLATSAAAYVEKSPAAGRLSPAAQAELAQVTDVLESGDFKVEAKNKNVKIQFLERWPIEAQRALYSAIYDQSPPLLVTVDELAKYTQSPDIEYVYNAWIVRSFKVTVDGETLYLAVYRTSGGEWGRETKGLEFFVVNTKTELILRGIAN